MTRSDQIALAACIISCLGLIPSFYAAFGQKKKGDKQGSPTTLKTSLPTQQDSNDAAITVNEDDLSTTEKPMPPMMRVFTLTVMAVVIGLIELIIFSAVAHFFGVNVDIHTMPLVWKVIFIALFIVPCVLLFLALIVLSTMFTD